MDTRATLPSCVVACLQSMQQQGGDAPLEEEARESEELGALDANPQDGSSSPEARPKESLLFAAARWV